MRTSKFKATHKSVMSYYAALKQLALLGVTHETAARVALQSCAHSARQCKWTLVP